MGVNIDKRDARLDLGAVQVRAGCGNGWVSADLDLVALLLDRSGRVTDPSRIVFHNNARTPDGTVVWSGRAVTGEDQESILFDLSRLDAHVVEVIVCVAVFDPSRRLNFGQIEGSSLVVSDAASGREVHRCELGEDHGTMRALEAVRLMRLGRSWQVEPLGRAHGDGLEPILEHYAPGIAVRLAKDESAPSPPRSRPADCDPRDIFAELVSSKPFDGYCSTTERQALVREAQLIGLDPAGAEIVLDFELERRRIANEAVLLQRLESILHQFTDDDKKLDDKERRDALQLACRPAGGCSKGLQYDVAEDYVTRFCRMNGVRVKAGLFKWIVP